MKLLDVSQEPDFTVDQEGGARWSVYLDKEHPSGYSIVTSKGRELLQSSGEKVLALMSSYSLAERAGALAAANVPDVIDPSIRQRLGHGKEATVYRMEDFAVREVGGLKPYYPALGELTRMDAINSAIDYGLPRWLNLPVHYALQADPTTQKTYTIMQRVDGGLTVEDILEYPNPPAERRDRIAIVEKALGGAIAAAQAEIPEVYDRSHTILTTALSERGYDPANYLTDWKPSNVLVEPLDTPIAGSYYNINVIDQYRA